MSETGIRLLDQARSKTGTETAYRIAQGSQVLASDIFLNLGIAGSRELTVGR